MGVLILYNYLIHGGSLWAGMGNLGATRIGFNIVSAIASGQDD